MSVCSQEEKDDLHVRMIEQRAVFVSRARDIIDLPPPENSVVSYESGGPVTFLPIRNIGSRAVSLSFQDKNDFSDFRLTIFVNGDVERAFHRYAFMEPLIITDENMSKIPESHLLYLSASETLRHYTESF